MLAERVQHSALQGLLAKHADIWSERETRRNSSSSPCFFHHSSPGSESTWSRGTAGSIWNISCGRPAPSAASYSSQVIDLPPWPAPPRWGEVPLKAARSAPRSGRRAFTGAKSQRNGAYKSERHVP